MKIMQRIPSDLLTCLYNVNSLYCGTAVKTKNPVVMILLAFHLISFQSSFEFYFLSCKITVKSAEDKALQVRMLSCSFTGPEFESQDPHWVT